MAKKLPEDSKWQERIQSWQESGLTQSAWCQQHGIRTSKFGYWKRKLEKASSPTPLPGSGFVSVIAQQEPATPFVAPLSITLPGGVTVSGIDDSNLSLVRCLVRDLL